MVLAGRFAFQLGFAHSAMPSGGGAKRGRAASGPWPSFGRLRDDPPRRRCDKLGSIPGDLSRGAIRLRYVARVAARSRAGRLLRPPAPRPGIAAGRQGFISQLKISIREMQGARSHAALGRGTPEWIVSAADDDRQSNRP
jgi:hypothetical protein